MYHRFGKALEIVGNRRIGYLIEDTRHIPSKRDWERCMARLDRMGFTFDPEIPSWTQGPYEHHLLERRDQEDSPIVASSFGHVAWYLRHLRGTVPADAPAPAPAPAPAASAA